MSLFHFCLSAAKNLSSFQLLPASLKSIGSSTDSPAFLSRRLTENNKISDRQVVSLPALSWWWGCHLLGIRLPLLWKPKQSMAFPPQQLLRLSRPYMVTRASSVLTGSTTRRWGSYLGRRGYVSSPGASLHFPLWPPHDCLLSTYDINYQCFI